MNDQTKLETFLQVPQKLEDFVLRPMSAGSMGILSMAGSPFFAEEQTEAQSIKSMMDYIFVHSADLDTVINSVYNGTFHVDAVKWACNFDQSKFVELIEKSDKSKKAFEENLYDVKTDPTLKKN